MIDDETWTRREKLWADVLAREIQHRKAAEAALQLCMDGQSELLIPVREQDFHPQVRHLGRIIEAAHRTLDSFRVPRGETVEGMDPDVHRSLSLEERILIVASQKVEWPKE